MSEKKIKREGWNLNDLNATVVVPWNLRKITAIIEGSEGSQNTSQRWGFPIDIVWTGRDHGGYYDSRATLPESMTGYIAPIIIGSWTQTDNCEVLFTNGPRFTFNDKTVYIDVSKCYLYEDEEEHFVEVHIRIQ